MGDIKLRAGYLLLRTKGELKREMLLLRAIALGIVLCAGALASSFFSRKILILPSFFGGIILLYFYFSQRLYITGKYYYLTGESTEELFLRFSAVLRYAHLKTRENAVKLLWLNFFLLPSRIVGVIIIRTFSETGNMQRVMLITLVTAFVLLSLIGTGFYSFLSGRYILSELLFIRCPNQKTGEILRSSALLTSRSLGEIMIFRLRSFFGKRGVTGKMRCALFSSDLFSDRKFYKNYGLIKPVTFPEPF